MKIFADSPATTSPSTNPGPLGMPISGSGAATPTLSLALLLAACEPFGAIEWVLSNARRTGVELGHLEFSPGHSATSLASLRMTVSADTVDRLSLFRLRLENGVDIAEVHAFAATHVAACDASGSNSIPSSVAAQLSRTMDTKSRTKGRVASAAGTVA